MQSDRTAGGRSVAELSHILARSIADGCVSDEGRQDWSQAPDFSGPDFLFAALLVGARLCDSPALRHGGGRGHLSQRHLSALDRPGTLAQRLRAALPPP